ncbi:hypothetical protein C8K30_110246 [Promicromonospora sp. AC04]|nr:hypothetical protein C8K30_110246 [Promicromonospora sp. AC04]
MIHSPHTVGVTRKQISFNRVVQSDDCRGPTSCRLGLADALRAEDLDRRQLARNVIEDFVKHSAAVDRVHQRTLQIGY